MVAQKQTHCIVRTPAGAENMTSPKKKGKGIPVRPWTGPLGFQEVQATRFQDSRLMKTVSLSGLGTGCLYPPGNIPGINFCCGPRSSVGKASELRAERSGIESR